VFKALAIVVLVVGFVATIHPSFGGEIGGILVT
jgi:hypothetical protein